MVSQKMLDKFKMLYLEKYNISLTNEEALPIATDLLTLVEILVKPEPTEASETEGFADETIKLHTT